MKNYHGYIQKLLFGILAIAILFTSPMSAEKAEASEEMPARIRVSDDSGAFPISKTYNIVYAGYPNCSIIIDNYFYTGVDKWRVIHDGIEQNVGTFTSRYEEKYCKLVLNPGSNDIILKGSNGSYEWTYRINMFYVPETSPQAKKNAVKSAISDADPKCINDASFAAAVAEVQSASQIDAISMYGAADEMDMEKHYSVLYSNRDSVSVAVYSSKGYASVRKDGTLLHTGEEGSDFAIESVLDDGENKYEIEFNKGDSILLYEICVFRLSTVVPEVAQLVTNHIDSSKDTIVDKSSYEDTIKYINNMINMNKVGKAKAIDAGEAHVLALLDDGTVLAWPLKSYSYYNKGQWNVPAGLKDVKAISAGGLFSLALKEDGTVVAWGDNSAGQCNVPQGLTDVKEISAGYMHALALKQDGTVVTWGASYGGTNGLTGISAVQAGYLESGFIKSDGSFIFNGTDGGYSSQTEGRYDFRGMTLGRIGQCYTIQNDNTLLTWSGDRTFQRPEYIKYFGWTNVDSASASYSYDGEVLLLRKDGTIGYISDYDRRVIDLKEVFPSVNITKPVQVKCSKGDSPYFLALQSDGKVVIWDSWGTKLAVPDALYKQFANINGMNLENPYNILYYENNNLSIDVASDFGAEVKLNGSVVKSVSTGRDTVNVQLNVGRNDIEITLNNPLLPKTYRAAVFYVPSTISAAIRQNIIQSVIKANSNCYDHNSFVSQAAALGNYKYFYIAPVGVEINKPFSIYYTERSQVNAELMNLVGTSAVYKDGAAVSNPISLQRGPNEFEIRHEVNGSINIYKVCLFYLPTEEQASLRSLVGGAVPSANARSTDEASYGNEINKLLRVKQIDIKGLTGPLPEEPHYRVFISEIKNLQLALTAYQATARIWINGTEVEAMTGSYSLLPLDLNQTINEIEVRFSDGQGETVNKITIFYVPPETTAAFKKNVINEVIAADAKSANETAYRDAVSNVVKNVRGLSFTDFVGAVDMNRPYRFFFTKSAQVTLQTFCLENARLEYVKYSSRNDSSSGGQDLGVLLSNTVINLNEGRNEIKVIFQHSGQEKVYRFCIIRGKSNFGERTTNDIISNVVSADNAMDGTEGTYNSWLGTVSNCYYDWQARWLTNWWW